MISIKNYNQVFIVYFQLFVNMKSGGSPMENRIILNKANLKKYMRDAEIQTDFALLRKIAEKLGKPIPSKYAETERCNFSNMVNGKRSLKVEYIIPLEQIFGVTLSQLINDKDYKDPDRKNLPYIKGINYYAHKDDMDLYEKEFLPMILNSENNSLLYNLDEFEKSFLDYVVKYKSFNAIKFLIKEFGFCANPYHSGMFNINPNRASLPILYPQNKIAMFLLKNNQFELFQKIFCTDSYLYEAAYALPELTKDQAILVNFLKEKEMYKTLFETRKIDFKKINRRVPENYQQQQVMMVNPFLNYCLDYALKHHKEFKKQIKEMLEFAITFDESNIRKVRDEVDRFFIDYNRNLTLRNGYSVGNLAYLLTNNIRTNDKEIDDKILRLNEITQSN